MTVLDELDRAVADTAALVADIPDDQWGLPTPCPEWSVAEVVAHLVVGHRVFAARVSGQAPPDPKQLPDLAPGEASTAYHSSAEEMLAAFRAPGALGRVVALPIGEVPGETAARLRVVEALVHGWDVATATGRPQPYDEIAAGGAVAFTEAMLPRVPTGHSPFGAPRPVPDDASVVERLAAMLGRDVSAQRDA